ncbi:hypothetical protein R0I01_11700 [Bacillus pumilus]|nr:hypothetical protein R0I01_11700 [Bacillus pumilus]
MKKTCMLIAVGLLVLLISGCMGTKEQTIGNQQVVKEEKGPLRLKETEEIQQTEAEVIDTQSWIVQKEPVELPILMYHSISSGTRCVYQKSEFAAHMKMAEGQRLCHACRQESVSRLHNKYEAK